MANQIPDPSQWQSGELAATSKQKEFVKQLSEQKGIPVDVESLAKADAARTIEELKAKPDVQSAPESGHLSHPEKWSTGNDPPTVKQKAFLASLDKEHGGDGQVAAEVQTKSEASIKIDELKQ